MVKESKNIQKKPSLTQKQKILLAFSILLFLILCVQISIIIYGKNDNRGRENSKQTNEKEENIVAEVPKEEKEKEQDTQSTEEGHIEESAKPESEKPQEETKQSTSVSVSTSPSTSPSVSTSTSTSTSVSASISASALTPPSASTPAIIHIPQESLTPRQQVEHLWTDPTSPVIYTFGTVTDNGIKYMKADVKRGTIKTGDTLKRTGICGIVPNISTKVSRITKGGKLVNSATKGETVMIAFDNDSSYKKSYFSSDLYMTKRVKLKVYVLTGAEGNTKKQPLINGADYSLNFVPKAFPNDTFLQATGKAVTSKTIKMGEMADIEIKDYILYGGFGYYEPGARIQITDKKNGHLIAIGAITGYPACPH